MAEEEPRACTKCGEVKGADEYYLRKDTGRRRWECKSCRNGYNRRYAKENREAIREKQREWCKENAEHIKARQKAYWEANKEYFHQKNREWHERNPGYYKRYEAENREDRRAKDKRYRAENYEKVLAREAAYRENNRDKVRAASNKWCRENPDKVAVKRMRRRARKLDAFVEDFTIADLIERDGPVCSWCEIEVAIDGYYPGRPDYATVDHVIPLAAGGEHSKDNCVVACSQCNSRKCASSLDEWAERMDSYDSGEGDVA